MAKRSVGAEPTAILGVVAEFLEDRGIDGWQLREVADRLRMSLSTLYKLFPSRDELIVAAVELWMEEHIFGPIETPAPEESLFGALRVMFHTIFEPWEQHPGMLHVYIRTGDAGARDRLMARGRSATRPLFSGLAPIESALAVDVEMILENVAEGAMSRCSKGEIEVTDILPILERTLLRLEQAANSAHGSSTKSKRQSRGDATVTRRRASRSK